MSNPLFKVFFWWVLPLQTPAVHGFFWFVTRWCLGANSPKAMDAKDRAGLDRGGGQLKPSRGWKSQPKPGPRKVIFKV